MMCENMKNLQEEHDDLVKKKDALEDVNTKWAKDNMQLQQNLEEIQVNMLYINILLLAISRLHLLYRHY